jgi:hypothetical protein
MFKSLQTKNAVTIPAAKRAVFEFWSILNKMYIFTNID